jgi:hypothetical protein
MNLSSWVIVRKHILSLIWIGIKTHTFLCSYCANLAATNSDKTDPWENAHGLALNKRVITPHDNYNVNDIISHIRGPCPNCQWYIESRGGRSGNFERKNEVKGEGKKEGQHYEAGT